MALRDWVHGAGRALTRALLHPRWRHRAPMAWTYLQLYLFGKRLTERRELSTLRSLVLPGMTIADIGANVGFYTLEMAAGVGRTGRVLAFEPDPFNFPLLHARAKTAASANVDAYQVALGDKNGRALLHSSAYNRADNRLSPSHTEPNVEVCEVEVRTLDEFLSARGTPALDALKIDVQGSEAHVLRGARKTLAVGVQWIWVEFSPDHLRGSGSDPERFLESLGELGMDLFEVNDRGGFELVTNYREHTRSMGSSYGDLVLMSKDTTRRLSRTAGTHARGAR
jgi:FkbM family methyltransferase